MQPLLLVDGHRLGRSAASRSLTGRFNSQRSFCWTSSGRHFQRKVRRCSMVESPHANGNDAVDPKQNVRLGCCGGGALAIGVTAPRLGCRRAVMSALALPRFDAVGIFGDNISASVSNRLCVERDCSRCQFCPTVSGFLISVHIDRRRTPLAYRRRQLYILSARTGLLHDHCPLGGGCNIQFSQA